ncbi:MULTISPECIES: ATP-binding protein [unclassified Caballeronia]|uniref:AAA family ATPase n=1 Tax=unclassified Caballeronia TaxID=2646786 RepID=UPI0020292161|nr:MULTISPECIES: ATP-binding protein [unclassified Caballeronia]
MAINNVDEDELFRVLNTELSASYPVTSPEHLYGREVVLERVRTSLAMLGRQIFIYGDRGVGKTSLAQTAAFRYQSADDSPVITSCHKDSTFETVMQDVIRKLRRDDPYVTKRTAQTKTGLTGGLTKGPLSLGMTGEKSAQKEETPTPAVPDANAAATLMLHEARGNSTQRLVVIDEFDVMGTAQRSHFADFLKQVGDQRVPVKFIFCGIGETVDDLLEAHGSANRYFDGVKVERLNVTSRWEIIDNSAKALGLSVDDEVRHRIAAISDGFPVYIHRICEKLYQVVFNLEPTIEVIDVTHLDAAITETILSIEHFIRKPYDSAIMRDDGDALERILWALADHSDLTRTQKSIHVSLAKILDALNVPPIGEKDFVRLIAKLRGGKEPIVQLHKGRRGLNEFRENIFRGYVRLRAEARGIRLALDYASGPDPRNDRGPRVTTGVSPLFVRPSFGRSPR